VLIGTGSALPARKVSNLELADKVDTSDEWIVERTGIRSRYIAGEGRPPPRWPRMPRALRWPPAWRARASTIVLATATPDQTFPATATIVQDALGANGGIAFDVAAVCSGFLYALGSPIRCCAAAWPAARW
jgi:3-oxoacyl-[acyl-carrier-protein] synthase-3